MDEAEGCYRAYLLRLWRVQDARGPDWRASLEDVRTHERHGFADLQALLAWLRHEAMRAAASEGPRADGRGEGQ